MRYSACGLILLLLSGCGGFRGGIESVPYIGEQEPRETSVTRSLPHELRLSEVTLRLSLNNTVRTYQYEVMLFIIPTYVNFWNEFERQDAKTLELALEVNAHTSAVTIDPQEVLLAVGNNEVRQTGVWVNNIEREHQVIEAYVRARRQAPADRPPPIPDSSEWRDAITAPVTIRPGEPSYRFLITFPLPLTSPEEIHSLDVSRAISSPTLPQVPLIRLKAMRWSEGYS